jgi:dihydropteroate synthase
MNGLTDKTIVDPAFGGWSEAKTLEDDRETFHRLREFRGLGQPILVSINRKNFLRQVADRDTEEALPVSLAATSMAVERGAHVVRTHDVAETRDAALIGAEFARDRLRVDQSEDAVGVEELDVTTAREADRHLKRLGADPDAASEAVSRVYELSGLTPEDRGALRAATADTGALFVEGDDPGRGLLFGTPGALSALEPVGAGVSGALDDALAALGVSVE